MIRKVYEEMHVIFRALERFQELADDQECTCDKEAGFTCRVHSDRVLAKIALKHVVKLRHKKAGGPD